MLNPSIPIGMATELKKYFNVTLYNLDGFDSRECGISRLIGNTPANLFIIQNIVNFRIDVPKCRVFYFHIDGAQSLNPSQIDMGFYLFNAVGKHSYKVSEKQKTLLPFVDMKAFDCTREKNIHLSYIPRDRPFSEYKDILERSRFTLIHAPIWVSKRMLEAIACRTVPIIRTDVPHFYYRMGWDNSFGYLTTSDAKIVPSKIMAQPYNIDKAFEWTSKHHSVEKRVAQMVPLMKMEMNLS